MKKYIDLSNRHLNSKYNGYSLNAYMKDHRVINFSPGPSQFPISVFNTLKKEYFSNSFQYGVTPFELSHRSPEFEQIINNVNKKIRHFMHIPNDFSIIWSPNGAHGQFSAVPLNLMNISNLKKCNYVVTGTWSHRAFKEALKFTNAYNSYHSFLIPLEINNIEKEVVIDEKDKYIFLCSNETVNGVEFRYDGIPYPNRKELKNTISVIDMSSDFGMKYINWNHIDIAFSCSSKNFGIPGVTISIIRNTILNKIKKNKQKQIPCTMDWNLYNETNSMYNTPSIFTIYLIEKILDYYISFGGINKIEQYSKKKSKYVYDFLDNSRLFKPIVKNKKIRSNINIPFILIHDDISLQFLYYCYKNNIVGLRTKTPFTYNNSIEPFRISLYNGISLEDTKYLIKIMKQFENDYL